jgi:Fe(3+) dicitrate transport protein
VIGEFAHISSGGFKELDTGGPTGFTRQDAMLKARAGAASGSDGHSVELKLGYGRERSYETYLGLTPDDFADDPLRRYAATDGDLMTWQRWQAEATWRVRADGLDLRTTVYSHRLVRAWEKFNGFASGVDMHGLMLDPGDGQGAAYLAILRGEEDTASPDQAILRGLNDRRYTASGLATRLRLRTPGERVANELELGLRAHVDDVTRLHSETPHDMVAGQLVQSGDPAITLDARESAWALAAHAHDDMTLGALHLLPGVRIEAIRTATGTAATGPVDPVYTVVPLPGLGAYLGVTPWLDLLGGAHRGFSPASPAATAAGTPPETAWNAEAGLRAHPAELQLEAIGFLSAYGNLVGECTLSSGCTDDQLGQQLGAGAAWVYGVESLLSDVAHLPGRLDLRGELTYTWTATQFRTSFLSEFPQFGSVDAGDALPYVPAHQGSASAGLEHRLFALDATVTARSGMRDVAGTGPLEPEGGDIAGIVVADLAAAARPHEGWELYCTVSNITDTIKVESWRPAGARPGAPRTVLAGVRADF